MTWLILSIFTIHNKYSKQIYKSQLIRYIKKLSIKILTQQHIEEECRATMNELVTCQHCHNEMRKYKVCVSYKVNKTLTFDIYLYMNLAMKSVKLKSFKQINVFEVNFYSENSLLICRNV